MKNIKRESNYVASPYKRLSVQSVYLVLYARELLLFKLHGAVDLSRSVSARCTYLSALNYEKWWKKNKYTTVL